MNVVAVLGSPRARANSSQMAEAFLEQARELGAETRRFDLREMEYSGCTGCNACKEKLDHCILADDARDALQAILDADMVVLASPVYYGELSGQLKCLFDRFFSFLEPGYKSRLPGGQRVVLLMSQAAPEPEAFTSLGERYAYWTRMTGFGPLESVFAPGLGGPGEAEKQGEPLERCRKLARQLLDA